MARMTLLETIDLINLDVTFPVGANPTDFGFDLLSGTGWRADVSLRRNDIATGFDLFYDDGSGFEQQLEIEGIGRPVVAPIGGPVQFLLGLVLDQDDTITGSAGNDGISGYKGDDVISGLKGADTLEGSKGSDELNGNRGRDDLSGGGGSDVLNGGRGRDRLEGGGGNDTFIFRRGDGQDVITDFEIGSDLIEIGRGARELNDLTFRTDGDDVVVAFANVEITVRDVDQAALEDDANFLF